MPHASAVPASSQPAASSVAEPENDDDSPDIPPFARSRTSEKEYLQLRDRQLRLQRGLDDLVHDPQARTRAIRTLRVQEQSVVRMQSRSAVSSGAPPLGPNAWTPLGPDPIPNGQTITNVVAVSGRVTAIAIDTTDTTGNTVYVGTAQGGLYRSMDGGSTWTALMDAANSLAIGAITIDPNNHNTLFVGTGEGNFSLDSFFGVGLYIIQNATTTADLSGPFTTPTVSPNPDGFTDVFTGRSITKILVNPANSNQILISTSSGFSGASGDIFSAVPTRGVYLSTNALGGSPTFARLSIQSAADKNRPVTDMVMDPNNANTVVVYVFGQTDTEGGIWVSNNAWAATPTWTQTFPISINENGKLAANHAGSTTTVLLAVDQIPSSGTCLNEGMLFKSTDAGATWPTEVTAARGFCGGQCFYDMPVALDPTSASNIFIGGAAGSAVGSCGSGTLGKSTNGGTSFAASQTDLHADSHAIAILPNNTNIMYEGNDGGIFRSTDGGATWSSVNTTGFNATQFESIAVHPTDPHFTIGGTQDNGTPFLHPDGVTWSRADFGDGGFSAIDQNAADTTNVTMYHTYFNESNNLVGFAQVTSVSSASDGNWNFFGCQNPPTSGNGITCADTVLFYAPLTLGPGNPNTVYYGTDRLYRSIDRGNTNAVVSQAPITANFAISAIGISPQDDNVRIVGLENGQVWATTSGSTTLTNVTGAIPAKYIGRAVIDPNTKFTAYVTLDGYGTPSHVWKTANLNAATPTWAPASTGLPDVPVNALAVDPADSSNVYVGTDIGVYNSTDGGTTWNPYGSGLPRVAVFDLKITSIAAGHKVRIATHGRGMWEIPAVGALVTTSGLTFSPSNPVFPNPITFTATVNTGASAIPPTGTVAFIENSVTLGTGTVAAGSASSSFTLAGGQHSITAQYSGDNNYLSSTSSAVTVTVANGPGADYGINFPNNSQTVKAGQFASYTVNVTTTNGFGGTINFACPSGLPSLTNCSFNPPQVSVSGNSGSTMLSISTTAGTAAPPAGNLSSRLFTSGGFLALGVVLVGAVAGRRRRKSFFLLLGILALATLLGSCGGGGGTTVVHNPGTPPGSYTVTVSATSGSTTHQTNITLVVQ
ncbi:MAG TPA: Ig-like domain repeat protein [Candidatus Angelobacter sp.]|nr:Ig-like domain repeat protein [Candidatus Angelobacter sp.]